MRIIAGKYKSRRISFPKNSKNSRIRRLPLRPTSDRARETLFDVFAGTGALGFEALSRGASEAFFVDKSGINIDIINKSAQELGCHEQIALCKEEAAVYLNGDRTRFDLVFADPPYDYGSYPDLVKSVLRTKPQIFVLETSISEKQNYKKRLFHNLPHIFSAK